MFGVRFRPRAAGLEDRRRKGHICRRSGRRENLAPSVSDYIMSVQVPENSRNGFQGQLFTVESVDFNLIEFNGLPI